LTEDGCFSPDVIEVLRCRWKSLKHIYDPTADLRRGKTNLLMYLQWYIRLVTATSRQLWTISSS